MTPPGTGKKVGLGPTGETVRKNVARLRGGMQYKELSEKLTEIGRPIPPLGLRRIEAGERRVDTDDLMALSIALDVTPNAILLPPSASERGASITGWQRPATERESWIWAEANYPLGSPMTSKESFDALAGTPEFNKAVDEFTEFRRKAVPSPDYEIKSSRHIGRLTVERADQLGKNHADTREDVEQRFASMEATLTALVDRLEKLGIDHPPLEEEHGDN